MADDMYGGELPDDGYNEELDAEGTAVTPNDAAHRQYEEAQSEIDQLKKRLAEMEAEAATFKDVQDPPLQPGGGRHHSGGGEQSTPPGLMSSQSLPQQGEGSQGDAAQDKDEIQAAKEEVDGRSVYVGNVDYATSPEELQVHFQSCGTINRVTILTDKFGGPKGYAYVEFLEPDAVQAAQALNETEIRGRKIKVTPKRTNIPGMKRGRGRGRGMYGRGGYYGRGYYGWYPPPPPPTFFRGRGRGRGWYAPY